MDSSQLKTLLLSTLSRRRCSLITVRDSPALFPAAVCLLSVSICCISSGVYDCDGWISPSRGSVIITPRRPLLALQKIKTLAHHFFFSFFCTSSSNGKTCLLFSVHGCTCGWIYVGLEDFHDSLVRSLTHRHSIWTLSLQNGERSALPGALPLASDWFVDKTGMERSCVLLCSHIKKTRQDAGRFANAGCFLIQSKYSDAWPTSHWIQGAPNTEMD